MLGNLLLCLWPKRKLLIFENTDSPATWNKVTWNERLERKQRWERNSFLCACACVFSNYYDIMTEWYSLKQCLVSSQYLPKLRSCHIRDACANVLFHSIIIYTDLLVVYRVSVNLIGYITRRLSADSLQLWIANKNRLFWARDACFTPQCTSRAVFETFELPM